jgi:hypothetical protein
MNLIDLRESDGPYWAAYQEERRREGIVDNPDFVPEWFLIKLMQKRFAAARVVLEQMARKAPPALLDKDEKFSDGYLEHFRKVTHAHDALRVLKRSRRPGSVGGLRFVRSR